MSLVSCPPFRWHAHTTAGFEPRCRPPSTMLRHMIIASFLLVSRAENAEMDDVGAEEAAVPLVAPSAEAPLLLLGPGNFSAAQLEHENLLVELCVRSIMLIQCASSLDASRRVVVSADTQISQLQRFCPLELPRGFVLF